MFVSRLDVLVDPILEARAGADQAQMRGLVGKVAIANAKLAYQDWKELCRGARWQALAARGARAQRLLWASTSTKDPRFSDVLYVESLIGPDTVDTIPPATLDAFRDHGKAESRLEENVDEARQVMATLARAGISIDDLTARLLDDGVKEFSAAFDALLGSIEKKRDGVLESALDRMSYRLPAPLDGEVESDAEGVAHHRQGAPAVGPRCVALDRPRREPVARLARHRRHGAGRSVHALRMFAGDGAARVHARGRARHGWLEPLSRCPGAHVRPDPRLS